MRRLFLNVNNQEIPPTKKNCGTGQHSHCDQTAHLAAACRSLANNAWLQSPCFVVNEQTFDRKINKETSLILREKLSASYHHAVRFLRALQPLHMFIDCYKILCKHSFPTGYPNILLLTHVNSNNNMAGTLTCALGVTLAPLNTLFGNYL
jgi:hypothetical protein